MSLKLINKFTTLHGLDIRHAEQLSANYSEILRESTHVLCAGSPQEGKQLKFTLMYA